MLHAMLIWRIVTRGLGTALSTSIMAIAFAFIMAEWCTQSHLSTESYEHARQGLRRTRRFKKYTAWFRRVPNLVILTSKWAWFMVVPKGRSYNVKNSRGWKRRSLVWTWQTQDIVEGELLVEQPRNFETYDNGQILIAEGLEQEKVNFAENEVPLAVGK